MLTSVPSNIIETFHFFLGRVESSPLSFYPSSMSEFKIPLDDAGVDALQKLGVGSGHSPDVKLHLKAEFDVHSRGLKFKFVSATNIANEGMKEKGEEDEGGRRDEGGKGKKKKNKEGWLNVKP